MGIWEDDWSEQNFLGISLRVKYDYVFIILQRHHVGFGVKVEDSVDGNAILEGKRIHSNNGTW